MTVGEVLTRIGAVISGYVVARVTIVVVLIVVGLLLAGAHSEHTPVRLSSRLNSGTVKKWRIRTPKKNSGSSNMRPSPVRLTRLRAGPRRTRLGMVKWADAPRARRSRTRRAVDPPQLPPYRR